MGKQKDVNESIGTPLDRLCDSLIALREPKKVTRKALHNNILDILNYDKKISAPKVDAFLIKAVYETFGESTTETEIVLMALGLLDGYDYRIEPKVMERRAEYLRKSEYISYNNATAAVQKRYRDNLRKTAEDPKLLQLAEFLLSLKDNVGVFLEDIDNYMNSSSKANLPLPNYVKKGKSLNEIVVVEKYLIPGKSFTIEHKATIAKGNKYEVKINLAEYFPGIVSALACILILFSMTYYRQSYQLQDNDKNIAVTEITKQDYVETPLASQELPGID